MIKHSKNRLESLSDGVFAFAATLMVVNISSNADFSSLKTQLPMFISFGISFFVMIIFWKLHYDFFRRSNYVDNWIITYNTLFLFTILFLFQLYSIGFSFIFLCLVFLYRRAYKKDTESNDRLKLLFYKRHFFIFVLVGLLSLIIAYFQIGLKFGLPGIIYSILGVLCYTHSKQFQKKYPSHK